ATPVGMKVRIVAEVTEVKGKLLTYSIKAYDEVDKICEGTHGRAIIELGKFLNKVNAKAAK
ncbi:MAG: thioesterase, partial [Anaerotignum sp.]|nr:thioesterase [Anaerotignum sp.]